MTSTGIYAPPAGTWADQDTGIEQVLGALDDLRHRAGVGAARTAVINLIVLAAAEAAADRAVRSIGALGRHHPGRIIVLVPRAWPEDRLAARVELHRTDVDDRCFWWEVVELTAGDPVSGHLDSLVEPLLLHDLKVALWLAGGTSRIDSPALLVRADHLIVSGERAASMSPSRVASDLADLVRRRPVTDLAWVATEPARQALARLFDPPARRGLLSRVEGVEASGPPWSTRLLTAWLAERLGLDPGVVAVSAASELRARVPVTGSPAAELDAGEVWPAGAGRTESRPGTVVARLGAARVAVPHSGFTTSRLLTTALTRMERDGRYEAVLATAGRLGG